MLTIFVYLVILGLVWFVVDNFLLKPYAPPVVRTIFNILAIVCVLVWLLNSLGLTHINLPK